MFVGQYQFTLDKKKRLVIPARLRPFFPSNEKETGVYVTVVTLRHGELLTNCLGIYPPSAWQSHAEWVSTAALQNEEARMFLRKLSSDTEYCKIDVQWRVVIPLRLINEANLKRDIMIIGMINHIEVWDLEKWRHVSGWLKEHSTDLEKYLYRIEK